MQEKLENDRCVFHEHALEIADLRVARLPHLLRHQVVTANDQDVFVVAAIEDDDLARRRHLRVHAPEIVVVELQLRRLFEGDSADTLRADAAHHVTDRAILP